MLHIKNIKKEYVIGDQVFPALKGIDLAFRKQEFVAILGHSGSGKTTLLNIVGGLDRYDSGDLIIDGISTKNYKDKDWDAYRNHRVGFVFQNYNLIPHLDILSNVELALTLSGVSREERIKRATEVLTRVGLFDHIHKRPNQLSGGQQQRVSIARALVNDPSIILADEPTGALDSETSVDIMNLLTEISKDKLIIMVTHNGELAKKYASRIVNLKDGLVVTDTNPVDSNGELQKNPPIQKTSMNFLTALRLSFKNLLTKKVRTLITALAGSIGIIGVALVMSLQHGFNEYLNNMEQDTFAGLPITVNRKYMDLSLLTPGQNPFESDADPVQNGVGIKKETTITQLYKTNVITQDYIDYLKDPNNKLDNYATVVYNYGFTGYYGYRTDDGINIKSYSNTSSSFGGGSSYIRQSTYTESFIERYFDIVAGGVYDNTKHQAVLIVDQQNRVPEEILQFLGFDTTNPNLVVPYQDIVNKKFKVFTNDAYYYLFDEEGNTYTRKSDSNLMAIYDTPDHPNTFEIEIVGILRVNTDFLTVNSQILFTDKTAEDIIAQNKNSEIVAAQLASPNKSVVFGKPFIPGSGLSLTGSYLLADALQDLGGSDVPVSISIYPKSFDDKEAIVKILNTYNDRFSEDEEDQKINYTDNIAAALSMIKTVMNSISAVLIAFSSISLFVSSVMIGIITYTSVLERTKEIGVLRSIGARKKDVSRVFNAEAILIGFIAGTLGVLIAYGLVPIANFFLRDATDGVDVANLFIGDAFMLIVISIALTFIAGLIPSRIAAKKDPVVALRTE